MYVSIIMTSVFYDVPGAICDVPSFWGIFLSLTFWFDEYMMECKDKQELFGDGCLGWFYSDFSET